MNKAIRKTIEPKDGESKSETINFANEEELQSYLGNIKSKYAGKVYTNRYGIIVDLGRSKALYSIVAANGDALN